VAPLPMDGENPDLLLIILDDLRRANFRLVRVIPDVAQGTSLTQEVPALIQFDLDFLKPLTIGFGEFPLLVQLVLHCDKALNMIEDRLILILHENLLHRGCDRNDHNLCYAPQRRRSTDPPASMMASAYLLFSGPCRHDFFSARYIAWWTVS
jgi:hypothetical protein